MSRHLSLAEKKISPTCELFERALIRNINSSIKAKEDLLKKTACISIFGKAVRTVVESYLDGGRLYIAGNGGSAADAQHLAAEFVSKLARPRAPLPAEALTVDSSIITAIGNDYGFDYIFSRQVEAKMTKKDVFLGITTSGKSKNILLALQKCKEIGSKSIIFTGRDAGDVVGQADYVIVVPGSETSVIQELHIVLAHTLCESVESYLFET